MTQPASDLSDALRAAGKHSRFRLVPYFTVASLVAFLLVAATLAYFAQRQEAAFQALQATQLALVHNTQEDFTNRHEQAARRDLLAVQEASNANLARILANALWESDLAPFVARAAKLPVEHCRALPDSADAANGVALPTPEKKACLAEFGRMLRNFPEFADIDTRLFATMPKSTVFKVKVFDLRGITVYSSEHAQMGEDKRHNAGWRGAAMAGEAMSELTFRNRFSTFEGVVENRDLISSYVPVRAADTGAIVAVFEVYTDVTPFLEHIRESTSDLRQSASDNQALIEAGARDTEEQLGRQALRMQMFIMLGLALLFIVLFAIIFRAARIMAHQEREREQAQRQMAQMERMASLGQMVAGVAHQLNTPLAFSLANIEMALKALERYRLPLRFAGIFTRLVRSARTDTVTLTVAPARKLVADADEADFDAETPVAMLQDTLQGIAQIREMADNLSEFTRLDRSRTTRFDISRCLANVVYIARSVLPTDIWIVEEYGATPETSGNVSQLNHVFINLINNAAQAIAGPGTITVRTSLESNRIRIDIADTGSGIAAEHLPYIWDDYYTTKPPGQGTGLGLGIARTIVAEHGGEISLATRTGDGSGTTFSIYLPVTG